MEIIARSYIVLLLLITCFSCKSYKDSHSDVEQDFYEIIEAKDYEPSSLYYKTIGYDKILFPYKFSYEILNRHNVRNNSIMEIDRFIDFDTIFSEEARKEINKKFKSLDLVELEKSMLKDPSILSKISNSSLGMPIEERKGYKVVSFPFIVKGKKGYRYGFIYRGSSMGVIYIYREKGEDWVEFAKLEIWIN